MLTLSNSDEASRVLLGNGSRVTRRAMMRYDLCNDM